MRRSLVDGASVLVAVALCVVGADRTAVVVIDAKACFSCHGTDLDGRQKWRSHTADGRRPAFSDTLTVAEIVAVLSHIKASCPADIRARHDDI